MDRLHYAQTAGARWKGGKRDRQQLTHSSNDLRLQSKLVLEPASEVADPALAISRDIRHLANVVEHVAAGEEQHGDQADSGPQIAVLQDRDKIWASNEEEGDDAKHSNGSGRDLYIIDGAVEAWVRACWEVTGEPGVHRFGAVGAALMSVCTSKRRQRLAAYPVLKSKRDGWPSGFAFGPVVGWKRSKTGAVWSIS